MFEQRTLLLREHRTAPPRPATGVRRLSANAATRNILALCTIASWGSATCGWPMQCSPCGWAGLALGSAVCPAARSQRNWHTLLTLHARSAAAATTICRRNHVRSFLLLPEAVSTPRYNCLSTSSLLPFSGNAECLDCMLFRCRAFTPPASSTTAHADCSI